MWRRPSKNGRYRDFFGRVGNAPKPRTIGAGRLNSEYRWCRRRSDSYLPTDRPKSGKIHAVGGIGLQGRNTPAHEIYDPAANRWTPLAYVPTARDHLAVAALGGRLYAVGGRIDGDYSRNLASNEAYDPATNSWEQRRRR
jgi:hypothetical protein